MDERPVTTDVLGRWHVVCRSGRPDDLTSLLHDLLGDPPKVGTRPAVEIDLPATDSVDLRLLDVLVAAQQRLQALGGDLTVRTRSGCWPTGPSTTPAP